MIKAPIWQSHEALSAMDYASLELAADTRIVQTGYEKRDLEGMSV